MPFDYILSNSNSLYALDWQRTPRYLANPDLSLLQQMTGTYSHSSLTSNTPSTPQPRIPSLSSRDHTMYSDQQHFGSSSTSAPGPSRECFSTLDHGVIAGQATTNGNRNSDGKKTYPCPNCDRVCLSAKDLRRHIKEIHDDIRDFPCPVKHCAVGPFKRKEHLVRHLVNTHNWDEDSAKQTAQNIESEVETRRAYESYWARQEQS